MAEVEDWMTWLTEEERIIERSARLDTVSVMYKADDVMTLLRSLAASRALVEEKDAALRLGMKGIWKADGITPQQAHKALHKALTLKETDMLKRLEMK